MRNNDPKTPYYNNQSNKPSRLDFAKARVNIGTYLDTASLETIKDFKRFYGDGTDTSLNPVEQATYNLADQAHRERFQNDYFNVFPEPEVSDKTRVATPELPPMGKGGQFIKSSINKYFLGGDLSDEEKANISKNVLGYANIAGDIFTSSMQAKSAKKSFESDIDDNVEVDKDVKQVIKDDFMTAREERGEAIGTGVGTTIGAAFGMPGLGSKIGAGIGKLASKLVGKKGKQKIQDKIEEEESEFFDFQEGEMTSSAIQDMRADEMSAEQKYLSSIGIGKYGGKFNGMVYGPRHEEGGVMMYKDGSPIAEVEGDEYVINNDILKDKPESNNKYVIQGTPLQIASALNSIKKYGVNTHPGGKVKQVR